MITSLAIDVISKCPLKLESETLVEGSSRLVPFVDFEIESLHVQMVEGVS
jgi:hypothetical protein